jgi:hypothetical protein
MQRETWVKSVMLEDLADGTLRPMAPDPFFGAREVSQKFREGFAPV